jgi:hypothetical protein
MVLGRVRVFEGGYELTPWRLELAEILAEDPIINLALFDIESGRNRLRVPISAEGEFEWILPAGVYLLYHTPSIEPPYNEPIAAFEVPQQALPVDLGELYLDISISRPLSWETSTYTLLSVAAAVPTGDNGASFSSRHPGTDQIQEGRFVVDPELAGLFTDWSRAECERILARHGLVIHRELP